MNAVELSFCSPQERAVLKAKLEQGYKEREVARKERLAAIKWNVKDLEENCSISDKVVKCDRRALLNLVEMLETGTEPEALYKRFSEVLEGPVDPLFQDPNDDPEECRKWQQFMIDTSTRALTVLAKDKSSWHVALAGKILRIPFLLKLGFRGFRTQPVIYDQLEKIEQDTLFLEWCSSLDVFDCSFLFSLLSEAWQSTEYWQSDKDHAKLWLELQVEMLKKCGGEMTPAALALVVAQLCSRTASWLFYCLVAGKGKGQADMMFHQFFGTPGLDASVWNTAEVPPYYVPKVLEWLKSCPGTKWPEEKALRLYFAAWWIYGHMDGDWLLQKQSTMIDARLHASLLKPNISFQAVCWEATEQACETLESLDKKFQEWSNMEPPDVDSLDDGLAKAKLLKASGRDKDLEEMLKRNPNHLQILEMRKTLKRKRASIPSDTSRMLN
ncbi:unnamed protein product [Durusdinium trenchii]|uniref:Uncharacterized protein n=2 Tax=Durusdinium trenchii TaxID=1381693 RepID=A0ABP0R2B6_9DINO